MKEVVQIIKTIQVRLSIFSLVVLTICNSHSVQAQTTNGVLTQDYDALVALYNATDGDNWTDNTNWLTAAPVSSWYGVTVSGDRVTEIALNINELSGTIPIDIGNLTILQSLNFDGNNLTGSIPVQIGNLTNLQSLVLSANQITGAIPVQFGTLSSLQTLSLGNNSLQGSIPVVLGSLTSLTYLNLSFNQLSGSIPGDLSSLINLETLFLPGNLLDGNVPEVLGNLPNLQDLVLFDNPLTGPIPDNFINLTSLSYFDFSNTDLCEPSLPAYQTWKAGVSSYTGTGVVCPPNDLCLDAVSISCGEVVAGSTVAATVDTGTAPNCGSATTTGPGVWYHFFGTGETITLSTCNNATFDTSISVFTGSCTGGLDCVAGNDDGAGCSGFTSELNFNSSLGTDYYILIHTWNSASGDFTLSITCEPFIPPPPNDNCVDAEVLTVFPVGTGTPTLGTNENATNYSSQVSCDLFSNITDVWYRFNSGTNSTIRMRRNLITAGTLLYALYTDCSSSSISCISGFDDEVFIDVTPGTEYWLQFWNDNEEGTFDVILDNASKDRPALELFYDVMNGDDWINNENWMGAGSIGTWFGITMENNRVTGIDLSENNLSGNIPAQIDNIGLLETLDLDGNSITGVIPDEIGNLGNLEVVHAAGNAIEGPLPNLIGLTNLTNLSLAENDISGDFPVLNAPSLELLHIFDNQLSGLPDLSGLGSLAQAWVYDNNLTFEDIESNVGIPGIIYTPQNQIPGPSPITLLVGEALNMSIPVAGSSNEYQWVKDGVDISGAISDNFFIGSTTGSDAGIYYLRITNPLVPGLTLISEDIIVTVSDTYYWVENGGPWDDLSHWATTSGGAVKHTSLPTINDNVFFDANSFTITSQVVEIPDDGDDFGVYFHNMDWTGVTNMPEFKVIANKVLDENAVGSNWTSNVVGGSLIFSDNMTLNFAGCEFYFSGIDSYVIDTKGLYLGENSYLSINTPWPPNPNGNGPGELLSNVNGDYIYVYQGEFASNGFDISVPLNFRMEGAGGPLSVDISNSQIETNFWYVHPSAIVNSFTANNSTISLIDRLDDMTGNFTGGGLTYNSLITLTAETEINNSNTFTSLEFSPGQSISLTSGTTQTIESITAIGTELFPITIQSNSEGSEAFFSSSQTIDVEWMILKDNHATGGGTFNATNTLDIGNVEGWNITCPGVLSTYYADSDGDGYGDPSTFLDDCTQPAGYVSNSDDCDDGNALINPDTIWYADGDGDGFGDATTTQMACVQPTGYVASGNDCDDSDANATIVKAWYQDSDGDGFGNNLVTQTTCNAPAGYVSDNTDCDDTNAAITTGPIWYADTDGDGFGNPSSSQSICAQPTGYVSNNTDCNDTDALINPQTIWYADTDGDGFGNSASTQTSCTQPTGFVSNITDCDDTNALINPQTIWYADTDGDGSGDPASSQTSCVQPTGFVSNNSDCDDSDATINPQTKWFADTDGDGYGDAGSFQSSCTQPAGFVSNSSDCNDSDASINPQTKWYADTDGDGYGNPASTQSSCSQPTAFVSNNTDCNDSNAAVYPGAPALADGLDNDCDGTVDKVAQTLTIGTVADQLDEGGTVNIVANATSGLVPTLEVEGPASITGGILTLTGAGKVTVIASQPGDNGYLPADPVSVTFCVNPVPEISIATENVAVLVLESNYETGNQWYLNNSSLTGETNQQYLVDQTGEYTVQVDIDGCVGESSVFNAVLTNISPETEITTTLFPNPVQEILKLQIFNLDNGMESEVLVIDINGSIVLRDKMINQSNVKSMELDVSGLSNGSYFLIIKTGDLVIRERFSKI